MTHLDLFTATAIGALGALALAALGWHAMDNVLRRLRRGKP